MSRALIALGANLGDRQAALDQAVERLQAHPQIDVLQRSRWHTTRPVGGPAGQPDFLNGVVLCETGLAPNGLLDWLRQIEHQQGRQRNEHWAARTLDLDLLLYDELILERADLEVPHPRMAFRRFVLEPAAEVAPEMIHPILHWSVARLFDHLRTARPYCAIAGGMATAGEATRLARAVTERTSALLVTGREVSEDWTNVVACVEASATGERVDPLLRLLEAQVDLLPTVGAAGFERWAVSAFWLEETFAAAEMLLTGTGWARFQQQWEQQTQVVLSPKLVVCLEAPAEGTGAAAGPLGKKLQTRMAALARRGELVPVLRLPADQHEANIGQVLAVLESMQ